MENTQEKISAKQKKLLKVLFFVAIVAVLSVVVWSYKKHNYSEKMLAAGNSYQMAVITYDNPNKSKADKENAFKNVVRDYNDTPYGIFASWYLVNQALNSTSLDSFNINDLQSVTNGKNANYYKAISILKKSIEANPKNSLTNISKIRLARLYIAVGQADNAIVTIKSAEQYDVNAYALMILGDAYEQEKDKQKTLEVWQKAYELAAEPNLQDILSKKINSIE